jgi:hypothetical protein
MTNDSEKCHAKEEEKKSEPREVCKNAMGHGLAQSFQR